MRSIGGSPHSRSNGFYGGQPSAVGLPLVSWGIALIAMTLAGCSSSGSNYEQRSFYQKEYGLETDGRKTWFDHLVEVDPRWHQGHRRAELRTKRAAQDSRPPVHRSRQRQPRCGQDSAHLPRQTAARKLGLDRRDSARRALMGFLAERAFVEVNIFQIDTVLKEHGIDSEEKLDQVPPETLGQWLGVDAVVYGEVTHYEAYYAALVSAWQVGANVKIVSTHDGEALFFSDRKPLYGRSDACLRSDRYRDRLGPDAARNRAAHSAPHQAANPAHRGSARRRLRECPGDCATVEYHTIAS